MLIKNFKDFKKYLPAVEIKGDITTLDDMFAIANDDLENDILGTELYTLVDRQEEDDKKLVIICERVISLSSFLNAIPELDLVLTQSGFVVHSSESLSPASRQRVDALIASTSSRLDYATDKLILFLLSNTKYDEKWRGTTQFDFITSGLISTYSEFKKFAQYSPATAERYPKSYSEFKKFYPNMNVALMTVVASYISQAYCTELLEKYKDREVFSAFDQYVLNLLRYALSAIVLGDSVAGREFIVKAVAYMNDNISHFPTFAASPVSQSIELIHEDTPIFSML